MYGYLPYIPVALFIYKFLYLLLNFQTHKPPATQITAANNTHPMCIYKR